MKTRNRMRRGATLLELLVVVAVLGMVLNVASQVLVSAGRIGAVGAEALQRARNLAALESEFLDVVRSAEAVLDASGAHRSDARTLVLRARGEDGRPRDIVIGALEGGRVIARMDVASGEAVRFQRYALPVAEYRFDYGGVPPAQARSVALHFAMRPYRGRNVPPQAHVILATPRNRGGSLP